MTITPTQYSKAQRRFLTALGGLGVAALAAGAFVLSYDDLRLLALRGGAVRHRAFLYPWMLDGLVVVVILAILSARRAGWFSRALRWLLLVLLIAGAGAAGVQRTVKGYAALPDTWVNAGVAVAPWAILIIAVWLWVSMIKQVLSRRARRSERADPDGATEPVTPADPAPAIDIDQPLIPGLGLGDTRPLPLPASTHAPEPAREPEPNPWDAARVEPPAIHEPVYSEPSDPVPPSWRGEESGEHDKHGPAEPSSPESTAGPPAELADEPSDEPAPEPTAETPANDEVAGPDRDPPAPRIVAQTSLPTDVRLVGPKQWSLNDTQPDGIRLPDTRPDGIPIAGRAKDDMAKNVDDDEEDAAFADERAEDPDAGEEGSAEDQETTSTPPSSTFRSSPTPPRG